MKYKEIEFKYSADDIKMSAFEDLVKKLEEEYPLEKTMMVSSYDDYFVDKANNFIRYRYTDDHGELTIKRKTTEKNNNERIEINIPTSGDNIDDIEEFCKYLGYDLNFSIYKTCKIFWMDNIVLVYYIVYDKNMKEQRRFIEIEADEEKEWESEEKAWDHVVKWEKVIESLGINAKKRLRKSLFEMFVKEKK